MPKVIEIMTVVEANNRVIKLVESGQISFHSAIPLFWKTRTYGLRKAGYVARTRTGEHFGWTKSQAMERALSQ
jgi:hypothetical protein